MTLGDLTFLVVLLPFWLVNATLAAELLAGFRRLPRPMANHGDATAVVIVPAHNEIAGIGTTVRQLLGAIGTDPNFSVLVVADNCQDGTASAAREAGANVLERRDPDRRGKGHALAFARDHLRATRPAAVLIVDADCRVDGSSLWELASTAVGTGRPAQAINLLSPAPQASAMVQLSTFAFLIKNKFRQRGLQRLSGGVHLTGTGMALPWPLFDEADLATSNIVEDLQLGIDLSARGMAPMLVEDAAVWSDHADHDVTLDQRRRWEGGYLTVARSTAVGLVGDGIRHGRLSRILAGLDLAIPPLAMLAMIDSVILLAALVLWGIGVIGPLSALVPLVLFAVAFGLIGIAWAREGRAFLSPTALVKLPLYVLWKLPMYAGLVRRGTPQDWNRTRRPGQ